MYEDSKRNDATGRRSRRIRSGGRCVAFSMMVPFVFSVRLGLGM